MFGLGALLALSPDSPPGIQDAALRRHPRRQPTPTCVAAAALAGGRRGGALVAARAAARGRLRPRRRRARSALARASPKPRSSSCSRLAVVVAVQGLGNLLVVAVFVGPAAAARQLTDRIAPMIAIAIAIAVARRRRRPLPLLLRRHRRRRLDRAGDRRRLPARLRLARATIGRWHALSARERLGRARARVAAGGRPAPRRRPHRGGRGARPPRLRGDRARDRGGAAPHGELGGRQGERLPGARAARGARPGAALRDLPRGIASYERVDPGGHHHHHAICRSLRADGGLRGPRPWSRRSTASRARSRFEVSEHDVVLRGRCSRCAARDA